MQSHFHSFNCLFTLFTCYLVKYRESYSELNMQSIKTNIMSSNEIKDKKFAVVDKLNAAVDKIYLEKSILHDTLIQ